LGSSRKQVAIRTHTSGGQPSSGKQERGHLQSSMDDKDTGSLGDPLLRWIECVCRGGRGNKSVGRKKTRIGRSNKHQQQHQQQQAMYEQDKRQSTKGE